MKMRRCNDRIWGPHLHRLPPQLAPVSILRDGDPQVLPQVAEDAHGAAASASLCKQRSARLFQMPEHVRCGKVPSGLLEWNFWPAARYLEEVCPYVKQQVRVEGLHEGVVLRRVSGARVRPVGDVCQNIHHLKFMDALSHPQCKQSR